MNRLGDLLGSATRGNIVEALALSESPLTAYRVAKRYNMNVAKVYAEMKKLEGLGLARPTMTGRGKEYALADEDLRRLALRLSSRVQTYEAWSSKESKRARFRSGMAEIPRYSLEPSTVEVGPGERRMAGELENLAALGRKKFDAKYQMRGDREYARL